MRSLLFVPGDSERKIAKGLACAADALILDLEDSVAPDRKPAARELCRATLEAQSGQPHLFVRINALDTADAVQDLAAIVRGRPFGIMLPKCRGAAEVARLSDMLTALEARDGAPPGATRILPIATETGAAMFGLGSYVDCHLPRLFGMLWGGEDLAADIGAETNRDPAGHYAPAYQLARSLCLLGAAAAGVAPIDAVFTDFRDQAGLLAEAQEAARSGFVGKAAIHPDQVETINRAFTPSAAALAHAARVVAAFGGANAGVAALDGKMLDRPHYRAALRVLERGAG
jgi:citrate lyase subunit beta/citryl-CoA lyase